MADPTIVHVHPYGNLWKIKVAKERNYHSVYRTRTEAAEAAIDLAKLHKPSKVIIHREDGSVENERSYDDADGHSHK